MPDMGVARGMQGTLYSEVCAKNSMAPGCQWHSDPVFCSVSSHSAWVQQWLVLQGARGDAVMCPCNAAQVWVILSYCKD